MLLLELCSYCGSSNIIWSCSVWKDKSCFKDRVNQLCQRMSSNRADSIVLRQSNMKAALAFCLKTQLNNEESLLKFEHHETFPCINQNLCFGFWWMCGLKYFVSVHWLFSQRVTKLGKFGLNGATLSSHTPAPLILPPLKWISLLSFYN